MAGEEISLRVTNLTEYRAWNSRHSNIYRRDDPNPGSPLCCASDTRHPHARPCGRGTDGVKRQAIGQHVGYFGAINLLGPRTINQQPPDKYWTDQFTVVQLRFSFVTDIRPTHSDGAPTASPVPSPH